MQALKEEISRVIELEAENAVLQESLRSLPQLQQDRAALLSLRERLKVKVGGKLLYILNSRTETARIY